MVPSSGISVTSLQVVQSWNAQGIEEEQLIDPTLEMILRGEESNQKQTVEGDCMSRATH